jgi:hypothetical protein
MVKERTRATVNTQPFEILPHRLLVKIAVFWLNCFPHKDGIHPTLSPHTKVTGSKINYNKHCKLQFEAYVQVHEQHSNSMIPRMSGAIVLHPTSNTQGSYYFLSLHSRKRIVLSNWTVLPMPAEVKATVHQLANACKKYKVIIFTDKDGNTINHGNNPEHEKTEITGVMEQEQEQEQEPEQDQNNNDDAEENTDIQYDTEEITGV